MSLADFPCAPSKIIGIGKAYKWNYHNEEVPVPLPEPLIFLRPPSSLAPNGQPIEVPVGATLAFEVEIAIVIGKRGKNIKLSDAESYIDGYALILDMCADNVQAQARKNGLPWAVCKGLDTMNPIGRFIGLDEIPDPSAVNLKLTANGTTLSHDTSANLIYTFAQEIAYASSIFTLEPGDIILTGAAKGACVISVGDELKASMTLPDGTAIDSFNVSVVERRGGYQFGKHWEDWLE